MPAERPKSPGQGRRPTLAVAVVGVLVAIGLPLGWWLTHQPSGFHSAGAGVAEQLAKAPGSESPRTPAPVPSPSLSTAASTAAPQPTTPPVAISIPSLAMSAAVVAEGVSTDGEMALPEAVSTVGWYRYSAYPGSGTGSVVVAGHVDSAVQGDGALARLRTLALGATVELSGPGGTRWTYRVVSREEFRKSVLPTREIFGRTGRPRLTLVTCGGNFDPIRRSYDDNVVVTAVPS